MSFSVQDARTGLEYNATLARYGLFCQRRNLASPRFWGMLRDLARFYREAPALLDDDHPGPSLGEYLDANGYGAAFRDQHLVPMASALWSSPEQSVLAFPAKYLVQFMANHHMLQLTGRPEWRVVRGGSRRYVEAMVSHWDVQVRLSSPVRGIARDAHGVSVRCDAGSERFDQVVLACHSDQALHLLDDASDAERDILGAIRYQANDTVLHTDARLLPRNRKAWAAWNAHLPADPAQACTVSYCMNLLQGDGVARTLRGQPQPQPCHRPESRVLRRMPLPRIRSTPRHRWPRRRRHDEIQGMRPHLVRRRLLGLGLPRGRLSAAPCRWPNAWACRGNERNCRQPATAQRTVRRLGPASPASPAPARIPLPAVPVLPRPGRT
jgi:predicted NAD/FAD-binding protein